MAQMKEHFKVPEKIQLSDKAIANLSDAQFKTLVVIRMLIELGWELNQELIELGRKMKKQMQATQSEIKQNIQGTNTDRKETRTQINGLDQKEEINIQMEQIKETRIQK